MESSAEVDYGPLAELIGTWTGDKGADVAPEPDGPATSPYCETITFTAAGAVENAEEQMLAAVHYHQIVKRKSNDETFHNETGYWMWCAESGTVMHGFTIPRAVAVIAGGSWNGETDANGRAILTVSAAMDDPDWTIAQSPFMRDKACTTKFDQTFIVGGGRLTYNETMMVDIYDRTFEHTDGNELTRA